MKREVTSLPLLLSESLHSGHLKTGKATDFEGAELIRHSLVYAGFKILVRLPDWNREGLKIPLLLDTTFCLFE